MSDLFLDDDNDDQSTLVKDLRAALKAANKATETATAEVTQLKGSVRKRTLEEVLVSKGVNAKVAGFIPSDVEGDEAVTKWLEDNGDVFGIKPTEPADTTPAGMSADDVAALKQAQSLSSSPMNLNKQAEAERAIQNAKTPEDLDAVLKQYGG